MATLCRTATLSVAAAITLCTLAPRATAQGILMPTDRRFPPCTITYQRVNAVVRDQAVETRVEQEFRSDASVPLEAFYLFPLPEKAGIKDFAMTVDGKRVKGEMVEAGKARQVYEDIVRRTRDPGLLEHVGKNLWRVRVFPVPPHGRQKFELTYTDVAQFDSGVASYTYPLNAKAESNARTEQDFTIRVELHSTPSLKSVYSPSHSVGITRDGDHKAIVGFEQRAYALNRDFQLFWTVSNSDVGLSLLTHRESPSQDGYFMLLVSPKVEIPRETRVPRDIVFVLDTSGSMQEGDKIGQARKALEFCLKALDKSDRFGLMAFSTTVNPYAKELKPVNDGTIRDAVDWVRKLEAGGGTAIADAMDESLRMRTSDARNFTVVFMTDGQPTIGETDPNSILNFVKSKNTADTRIFTFGVGDDVNTHLLDQIADQTRAASVYVRPKEDLEVKVSGFYDKIRHPVFANLQLSIDGDHRLSDMYPPKLPDLFHGGQLVVAGRYTGKGDANIRLTGKVGDKEKEFIYKVSLPEEKRDHDFVPSLWARRKVGYLLDEIRLRGENTELRDSVIALAKRYGIATPYTSYLVVPDQAPSQTRNWSFNPPPTTRGAMPGGGMPAMSGDNGMQGGGFGGGGGRLDGGVNGPLGGQSMGGRSGSVGDNAGGYDIKRDERRASTSPGKKAKSQGQDPSNRFGMEEKLEASAAAPSPKGIEPAKPASVEQSLQQFDEFRKAGKDAPARGRDFDNIDAMKAMGNTEAGQQAVDLSLALKRLKESSSAGVNLQSKDRAKTSFVSVNGVWIDRAYKAGMKSLKVKYLSDAYFAVLAKVPNAKEVLSLGERIVWVTPGEVVLIVDATGAEKLSDAEADSLVKKAK